MPVRDYLRQLIEARADMYEKHVKEDPIVTRNEAGAVVSIVIDLRTGRIIEGSNRLVPAVLPDDLHPILQAPLDELVRKGKSDPFGYVYIRNRETGEIVLQGRYPHYDVPGTHAEIQAVNRMLYDREAMGYRVTPDTLGEFLLDNLFLEKKTFKTPARCCPNCTAILGKVIQSVPGWREVDEFARRKDG